MFARPLALVVTLAVLVTALPANAETIFLKNGTQLTGKIVKEDANTFSIDTPDGRRKVAKGDVEVLPTPDPVVTFLVGLLFSGGGHVYVGQYDRAGLFLTLGVAAGAAGYLVTRQIRPSSPSTAAVAGVAAYAFPALVGAFDALGAAQRQSAQPRYHVDYESR
jgi:hypothetical protein